MKLERDGRWGEQIFTAHGDEYARVKAWGRDTAGEGQSVFVGTVDQFHDQALVHMSADTALALGKHLIALAESIKAAE